MVAFRSAQTATPGLGTRSRVASRARSRARTPVEGGFVHSRYAPASHASVAAASALIDQRRIETKLAPEVQTSWARKLGASFGIAALTVVTGVFFAALIAGSVLGLIVAVLNIDR
jgi:hypothetical protein